jgi:hypothetical protein
MGRDFRRAVQVLERHGLLAAPGISDLDSGPHRLLTLRAGLLAAQCLAATDK